jgi:MFS family permease
MTTTMLDRVVRWNLDFDGDLYGDDERERLRWYEGIATAASLQWMALPWAAAVLVLLLGRASVVPTLVMLLVLLIPMALSAVYVRRRRVETTPRRWGAKRVLISTLSGLPWVVYCVAALQAWQPEEHTWQGATVGAVIGGSFGLLMTWWKTKRRRERDAAAARDED